ncbi:predicted protein [Phaeodactylum tricornutum CCAP 1055/1]|uniref:F-box domain-containing protein n=2 Tax=Phaeodactylum tricornutum TaxID=2850 RepID=B7G6T9_PHATC|nr:predicted protein [Phaeodactylum tricornutum CCAP 1055/1]EEC45524.1 predicted protein [Phaeodactylum tricornutum CCAP 1055/1]|eukprot:XP_002182788.1 predicted protein [Phaeodactylum tricornutum CCAP 1055/1]
MSPNGNGLLTLPLELQVRLLTYLRAYDLAAVQQVCRCFRQPELVHGIVAHAAEHVYPPSLTRGFDQQPTQSDPYRPLPATKDPPVAKSNAETDQRNKPCYTFEHLRNMELLVVARVLNSPEPSTGYIVSKSWCKSALKWLEAQQEEQQAAKTNKKISKKKQRLRQRRLSDISPPWPNVNSDLLCEHSCLSRCSNGKSARARRRYVNKQAWKILKKLYPDSTSLDATTGECLQCFAESEMNKKNQRDEEECRKLERKRPLSNPSLRRLYTRRTGVPLHAIRRAEVTVFSSTDSAVATPCEKIALATPCPLRDGKYFVLPRAWCHQWRRYMKTGEGGPCPAPDAAGLLCDAHRLPLLPPHLEAYLEGQATELFASNETEIMPAMVLATPPAAAVNGPMILPGQGPDQATLQAMREAGLGEHQIGQQLSALRLLETQQRQYIQQQPHVMLDNIDAPVARNPPNKNELLDRENHSVVELLAEEEYQALESCYKGVSSFALRLDVVHGVANLSTPPCRACDASGRASRALVVKNRARSWVKKSGDQPRAPASLEY